MRYVDGFLIPVPKRNLRTYQRMSKAAGRVWMKLGAVAYCEAVGDDLEQGAKVLGFPKTAKAKRGETVMFSWIVYRSKAHRNRVNKLIMKDPTILKMMKQKSPFDMKRMVYGGFKTLVDL